MIEHFAEFCDCFTRAQLASLCFALALIEFPRALMKGVALKGYYIPSFVIRLANTFNKETLTRLLVQPKINEFLKLIITYFLQPNCNTGHLKLFMIPIRRQINRT